MRTSFHYSLIVTVLFLGRSSANKLTPSQALSNVYRGVEVSNQLKFHTKEPERLFSKTIMFAAIKDMNKASMLLTRKLLAERSKMYSTQYGRDVNTVESGFLPSCGKGNAFLPLLDSKKRIN